MRTEFLKTRYKQHRHAICWKCCTEAIQLNNNKNYSLYIKCFPDTKRSNKNPSHGAVWAFPRCHWLLVLKLLGLSGVGGPQNTACWLLHGAQPGLAESSPSAGLWEAGVWGAHIPLVIPSKGKLQVGLSSWSLGAVLAWGRTDCCSQQLFLPFPHSAHNEHVYFWDCY